MYGVLVHKSGSSETQIQAVEEFDAGDQTRAFRLTGLMIPSASCKDPTAGLYIGMLSFWSRHMDFCLFWKTDIGVRTYSGPGVYVKTLVSVYDWSF